MLHRARIEFWWSSLSKTWCEELLRENISVEVFNIKLEKDTGCRKNNYKEGAGFKGVLGGMSSVAR